MTRRHHVVGDLIFLAAFVVAVILAGHIIFVLLGANPTNNIASTDADWSRTLAAWFHDLFTPKEPKLRVVLNYGLAMIFYLIVGDVLRRLVGNL